MGVSVIVGVAVSVGVTVGVDVLVAVAVAVGVSVGVGVADAKREMDGMPSDPSSQNMRIAAPATRKSAAIPMINGARRAACWRFRYWSITFCADSLSLISFHTFSTGLFGKTFLMLSVILPYFHRLGES